MATASTRAIAPSSSQEPLETEARKLQFLTHCSVFAGLSGESLEELLRRSVLAFFPKRKRIHEQGEAANAVYVLGRGRARVVRRAAKEREMVVGYRFAGEVIGEAALAGSRAHSDAALAAEPVEALRIPASLIGRLLELNVAVAGRLLRLIQQRRLEAEARLEALMQRPVEARVALFLMESMERDAVREPRGLRLTERFTHQEIADYVGAKRETVTLSLGELRQRRVIEVEKRDLVVVDAAALVKLARA